MIRFPAALISLFLSLGLLADAPLTEAELKDKATAFIAAKNARQQPDTTVSDIDYFLSLIADEFVDEHVKFGVTVTDKEELRRGMIAKMDDEVYFCEIAIDEMMFGRNVAFVKYTEHARVKPGHLDQVIEYTSTNLLSLEFNDAGLITHIRRHHGL
jgi:hypothetical protein